MRVDKSKKGSEDIILHATHGFGEHEVFEFLDKLLYIVVGMSFEDRGEGYKKKKLFEFFYFIQWVQQPNNAPLFSRCGSCCMPRLNSFLVPMVRYLFRKSQRSLAALAVAITTVVAARATATAADTTATDAVATAAATISFPVLAAATIGPGALGSLSQ
jgi:hypothetical protein